MTKEGIVMQQHFILFRRAVTLHSYRYAWAERAKTVGHPERFAQEALARTPKSKSSAAQLHGERTPLACGFQRLAENLVPQTFSRQNRTKHVRRRFGQAAQTGTRAACATHSDFGVRD
jgi:hypothetical protein